MPAAIGALALVLRLYGIGDKPFWLDELSSLRRTTETVPDLVSDSLHSSHYPSYFLILWLIGQIGTSEWLLRLPSAAFGAVGASLTCAIGRRVAGSRAGVIAGLLMACSPFEVELGQDARSYTLASCLILTALLALVRLVQEPAAALPMHRQGAMRIAWLAYCLGTAAALSVLNIAVAWLLVANLAVFSYAWYASDHVRGSLRNWCLAQIVILAIWLPSAASVYLVSKGGVLYATAWVPAVTAGTLWSTLAAVYLLRIPSFITLDLLKAGVPALALVAAALMLLGIWRLRQQTALLTVLGSAALLPPIGLLLASPFVPVLLPRYLAWSAAPFFILAGAGIGRLPLPSFAAGASGLAVACLINLWPYYSSETKPRWDLAAAELAAVVQPGDVVLLDHYYSYIVLSAFASRTGLDRRSISYTLSPAEAAAEALGHDVWAVYGRTGQGTKKSSPVQFRQRVAPLGEVLAEHPIGHYIIVWRLRPPARPVDPVAPQAGERKTEG